MKHAFFFLNLRAQINIVFAIIGAIFTITGFALTILDLNTMSNFSYIIAVIFLQWPAYTYFEQTMYVAKHHRQIEISALRAQGNAQKFFESDIFISAQLAKAIEDENFELAAELKKKLK